MMGVTHGSQRALIGYCSLTSQDSDLGGL